MVLAEPGGRLESLESGRRRFLSLAARGQSAIAPHHIFSSPFSALSSLQVVGRGIHRIAKECPAGQKSLSSQPSQSWRFLRSLAQNRSAAAARFRPFPRSSSSDDVVFVPVASPPSTTFSDASAIVTGSSAARLVAVGGAPCFGPSPAGWKAYRGCLARRSSGERSVRE